MVTDILLMRVHAFIYILFLFSAERILASGKVSDDDDIIMLVESKDDEPSRSAVPVSTSAPVESAASAARPPPVTAVALQAPPPPPAKSRQIRAVKADGPLPAAVASFALAGESSQAIKKVRKNAAAPRKSAATALPPTSVTLLAPSPAGTLNLGFPAPLPSTASNGPAPLELMTSLIEALESRTFGAHNYKKISSHGYHNFSVDQAHILLLKSIAYNKDAAASSFLKSGWRLKLDKIEKDVAAAVLQALGNKKYDFMSYIIDFDPVGATKLFISMGNMGPHYVTDVLSVHGHRIDPGAIRLAAETAAKLQSIQIFKAFVDSGFLLKMVSRSSLVCLFSVPIVPEIQDIFTATLTFILNDRKLAGPFEPHLLLQAAIENQTELFHNLFPRFAHMFSWDMIIKAFCVALDRHNYSIALILIRQHINYTASDYVFSIVSENNFLVCVAQNANFEVFNELINAVHSNGSTLLIPQLSLLKIYLKAVKVGNFDVVYTVLKSNHVSIADRVIGKSIFRIAFEHGQFSLIKSLVRYGYYKVSEFSDSPTINPAGDALIYVAKEEHAEFFEYLLVLGANPNVLVYHGEEYISLFNWCLLTGKFILCKLLLGHGYKLEMCTSRSFAKSPEAQKVLLELISNH